MWFMASEAGEFSLAVLQALGLAQIHRLVTKVPGIVPVDACADRRGRPVAAAAELVERGCRKPLGIADAASSLHRGTTFGGGYMIESGTVASLALDSRLERLEAGFRVRAHRTCGVTLEASQDSGLRIGSCIGYAHRLRQRLRF